MPQSPYRFHHALVLVASLGAACGPPRTAETLVDRNALAAKLPHARVWRPTSAIDFGHADARSYLVSGWGNDRVDGRGLTFVSSVGSSSRLSFESAEPREQLLVFRCRPQRGENAVRSLAVQLNGATVASVALEPRLGRYRLRLPAEHLRTGENELGFFYGYEYDGGSRRVPGVDWYDLELPGLPPTPDAPFADADLDLMVVPYGVRIDLALAAVPGAVIRADRVDFEGGVAPRLDLGLLTDGGERHLATVTPGGSLTGVELGLAEPDAVVLTLRAEAGGDRAAGDGVYLKRAVVQAPGREDPDASAGRTRSRRPNILVYLVDTLRADRLSTYGHERATSPRLDEFAARATLFEHAIAQSSWTRPAVASLFTGLWPGRHLVNGKRDALPAGVELLAERLAAAGYETAGFTTNANIAPAFGFDRGFTTYRLLPAGSDSVAINRGVFAWLERRKSERPFFLYVHTADPHSPYLPPDEFRRALAPDAGRLVREIEENPEREVWDPDPETVAQLLALYDAEVAANDSSFGALLDRLRERGLYDDSLVVFLSDHGEEFAEHGGWNHGRTLFAEVLDVPLVVKLPGQKRRRRIGEVVQHVDLVPTLVDYLELAPEDHLDGRSLVPLLADTDAHPAGPRTAFAHVSLASGVTTGALFDAWKLIDRPDESPTRRRLFERTGDRAERRDLATEMPVRTLALASLLAEQLAAPAGAPEAAEADLDPELEQRLQALGYL